MRNGFMVSLALIVLLPTAAGSSEKSDVVGVEENGFVKVEAEKFVSQEKDEVRKWHIVTVDQTPDVAPDGDESHAAEASGRAYIEILPDTRRTHDDTLTNGENFTNEPGKMAVISYPIRFATPGRYHVWVRAYSTGSEDNGIHAGIDGAWPESGARMQWCAGKNQFTWESKQRTQKVHCGEPYKIYLDVDKAGVHVVAFSMREDGFEFDQFLMTQEREFKPE